MPTEVLVVVGIGGMGQEIARRQGPGKSVLLADFNEEALGSVAWTMTRDGYTVQTLVVDVSSADSVDRMARRATELGAITQLAHTAGLSPTQASAEAVLRVDLLGAALVVEAFGEIIAPGGAGVVIASMAGHLFPALTSEQEDALARTSARDLLSLAHVSPDNVTDSTVAYGLAKQANQVSVRRASLAWGRRGARINSISPGTIATPMGHLELDSPMGEGIRALVATSAAGRLGTPQEIAAAAAFLLGPESSFITGTDLLVDGGAVAALRCGGPALGDQSPS
jgi:NAD(P)-dependent dehydrogenase (short-subunit alcohol dehydrogenase family)